MLLKHLQVPVALKKKQDSQRWETSTYMPYTNFKYYINLSKSIYS